MLESKKFKSVLIGALVEFVVVVLVALLNNFGIDVDATTLTALLVSIAGMFGVHIGAQGYADGKTGGLTSSNAVKIIEATRTEAVKN